MQLTSTPPQQPYDFPLSAAIFAEGDRDIRTFKDGMFRQVLDTGKTLVLAEVWSSGTTEDPKLTLTFMSDRPVPAIRCLLLHELLAGARESRTTRTDTFL